MSDKPLVTFALFCYNHEAYIREAVEGALSQTYSPLEIYISDDCSTDKSFEIIQETVAGYNGPHKVILNRNERNLGWPGHLYHVFDNTVGELIVMAAGDDISMPERSAVLTETWMNQGKPSGIGSNHLKIDHSGLLLTYNQKANQTKNIRLLKISHSSNHNEFSKVRTLGSTAAWSRNLIKNSDKNLNNSLYEDVILSFRSYIRDGIAYINTPLVKYRHHEQSLSSRNNHTKISGLPKTIKNHHMRNIQTLLCILNDITNHIKDYSLKEKISIYICRLLYLSSTGNDWLDYNFFQKIKKTSYELKGVYPYFILSFLPPNIYFRILALTEKVNLKK